MNTIKFIQNLILPTRCLICQKPSNQKYAICKPCQSQLPYLKNTCHRCASILPEEATKKFCANCLKYPPYFDRTIALFRYQDAIIKLITNLKFNKELVAAKLLGRLFCEHLIQENTLLPDLIIPVPLHIKRLKQRGYNQAIEIAKPVAKKFNIPLLKNSCIRTRHTKPQTELPAGQRKMNIKNAFEIKKSFTGLNIAIFDDVMTTGTTVNELSYCLKKAGAKNIDIWCCARTIFDT